MVVDNSRSECCPRESNRCGGGLYNLIDFCLDGRVAVFYECCGKGSCNVACCNCDNGCIQGDYNEAWKKAWDTAFP